VKDYGVKADDTFEIKERDASEMGDEYYQQEIRKCDKRENQIHEIVNEFSTKLIDGERQRKKELKRLHHQRHISGRDNDNR
jgi:ClpP class serine protease